MLLALATPTGIVKKTAPLSRSSPLHAGIGLLRIFPAFIYSRTIAFFCDLRPRLLDAERCMALATTLAAAALLESLRQRLGLLIQGGLASDKDSH